MADKTEAVARGRGILGEAGTRSARAGSAGGWSHAAVLLAECDARLLGRADFVGTQTAEYVPDWLANARMVLVGDAAQVPTQMAAAASRRPRTTPKHLLGTSAMPHMDDMRVLP